MFEKFKVFVLVSAKPFAMSSVENKMDKLRLDYLSHAALVVKNPTLAKNLGRRFLQVCPNKNTRLVDYFACLKCGMPRARDGSGKNCSGCP